MWSFGVPNVPCGVERRIKVPLCAKEDIVPNVPCGVERDLIRLPEGQVIGFLMYRVELKAFWQGGVWLSPLRS